MKLTRLSVTTIILGIFLLAALPGCEDKEVANFIFAFDKKNIPAQGKDTLDIILFKAVEGEKAYVELISNSAPLVVQASYGTQVDTSIAIKFKTGEDRKTVNLSTFKKTGSAVLRFQIRDLPDSWQDAHITVGKVTYPDGQWDSGPMPDRGMPEQGTPDAGPAGDKGAPGDKGTPGDKSTATPDKSTATPDASTSTGG